MQKKDYCVDVLRFLVLPQASCSALTHIFTYTTNIKRRITKLAGKHIVHSLWMLHIFF